MKYLEHSIKAEDTRYRDFTAEKDSYFQQSGIPFGFHSHPEQTGLGLGSIFLLAMLHCPYTKCLVVQLP